MNPIGNCERREPRKKDRTDADSAIQLPLTIDSLTIDLSPLSFPFVFFG